MSVTGKTLRRETRTQPETGVTEDGAAAIAPALNAILADLFALYVKTKNFHGHMAGPHLRDYDLLLDDQSAQVLATIDPAAERVRKLGRSTIRSIGQISRLRRAAENDAETVAPADMLRALCDDNRLLAGALRDLHDICDRHGDIATASLI
jgi:starvation-inducible DNA-binding protein